MTVLNHLKQWVKGRLVGQDEQCSVHHKLLMTAAVMLSTLFLAKSLNEPESIANLYFPEPHKK